MTTPGPPSSAALLVLQAVRVTGLAGVDAVALRSGVDAGLVSELLGDYEARGWVSHVEFAGTGGWTLTERGRIENTRALSEELTTTGARDAVEQALVAFDPLNARVVRACTDWQLRPQGNDHRLTVNTHDDPQWDARILDELCAIEDELRDLVGGLATSLPRFDGYQKRFAAALARARSGQGQWVAGIGLDSCHVVWMELHEDLLSTLGISRDAETEGHR